VPTASPTTSAALSSLSGMQEQYPASLNCLQDFFDRSTQRDVGRTHAVRRPRDGRFIERPSSRQRSAQRGCRLVPSLDRTRGANHAKPPSAVFSTKWPRQLRHRLPSEAVGARCAAAGSAGPIAEIRQVGSLSSETRFHDETDPRNHALSSYLPRAPYRGAAIDVVASLSN
jgi:hypothetical protein